MRVEHAFRKRMYASNLCVKRDTGYDNSCRCRRRWDDRDDIDDDTASLASVVVTFPSVIGTAYTIYATGTTRNLEGTFRLLATMTAEVPERDQEETGGADVMDPSPVNDLCENAVHLIVDDTGEPIWGTV